MNFTDVDKWLDAARSDDERIDYLKRVLHRLRGVDYRAGLLALANLYALKKDYPAASMLYEKTGMKEEAKKARARFSDRFT